MPLTKVDVVALNGVVSVAGAGVLHSDPVDLRDSYGAVGYMYVLNGASAPSVACYMGYEYGVDEDNDGDLSSGVLWFRSGKGMRGDYSNNGVVKQSFDILTPAAWIRFWYGYNKDQNCTVTAGIIKITSLI
jgi:hypothetical protein